MGFVLWLTPATDYGKQVVPVAFAHADWCKSYLLVAGHAGSDERGRDPPPATFEKGVPPPQLQPPAYQDTPTIAGSRATAAALVSLSPVVFPSRCFCAHARVRRPPSVYTVVGLRETIATR